jgi:hypothetical protein
LVLFVESSVFILLFVVDAEFLAGASLALALARLCSETICHLPSGLFGVGFLQRKQRQAGTTHTQPSAAPGAARA